MNIEWVGNSAFATKGDMRYKVAYKHDGAVCLTVDGKWLFPDGLNVVAYTSADVVPSQEPKKRGRKTKVEDMPDLDEMDI